MKLRLRQKKLSKKKPFSGEEIERRSVKKKGVKVRLLRRAAAERPLGGKKTSRKLERMKSQRVEREKI